MKFICKKTAVVSSTIAFAILSLAQPANAITFDWQFTNDDGNFGNPTDVVAGFVEFNDADVFPNATNVAATNLQITSVTGLNSTSTPFFGDGLIELNQNLVSISGTDISRTNSFDFDATSNILINRNTSLEGVDFHFQNSTFPGGGVEFAEVLTLTDYDGAAIRDVTVDGNVEELRVVDFDSSSLTFTQQASTSIPFEFSPTLGLLVVGGVFVSSGYIKHRKAVIK